MTANLNLAADELLLQKVRLLKEYTDTLRERFPTSDEWQGKYHNHPEKDNLILRDLKALRGKFVRREEVIYPPPLIRTVQGADLNG